MLAMLLLLAFIVLISMTALALAYFFAPVRYIAAFLMLIRMHYRHLLRISTKSVTVKGLRIKYLVRNPRTTCTDPSSTDSSPTIVLIHGISGDKYGWYSLIRCLPQSWRIIAPDLPGHGESGFEEKHDYSADGMDGILHEFVLELGLKKFHLLGESLGALYSAYYASEHPQMLSSLTLICPPGTHRLKGGQASEHMTLLDNIENLQEDSSIVNPFLPKNGNEARETLRLAMHQQYHIPLRLLDAMASMRLSQYPQYLKVMRDMASTTLAMQERLESISAPLQVLWGKNDQICHVSGAEVIRRIRSDARVVVIDQCGHVVTVDRPNIAGRLVTEFVQKIEQTTNV